MKVQILSDLHLERFYEEQLNIFLWEEIPVAADILLIAGDFATGKNIMSAALEILVQRFKHIIHVAGNHEYYSSSYSAVRNDLSDLMEKFPQFHSLENEVFILEGRRFVGTTLWFPPTPDVPLYSYAMNDFALIHKFLHCYSRLNKMAVEFLRENIQEGDTVITHHAPSFNSVDERYKTNKLNCFFVCPQEELILAKKPFLWVHGHMHNRKDYFIGNTRILCNPFGYIYIEETECYLGQVTTV